MKRELKAKVVEKPSLSLPSKDHAIYGISPSAVSA